MNELEIYAYGLCPVCGHDTFYSCQISTSTGDTEEPPDLEIRPAKFKFTLIESYRIDLPHYWAACPKCGGIFTKVDGKRINRKIDRWAKSDIVENTLSATCSGCNSKMALLWQFAKRAEIEHFYVKFNWAKSFNYSFGLGKTFEVGNSCILCLYCGLIQVQSTPNCIAKNAHDRYLKQWPAIQIKKA